MSPPASEPRAQVGSGNPGYKPGLRPRVANRNKWRRIERLRASKVFQHRYREAHNRRKASETDVVFPYGTYKLREQGLARCTSPPPPE